MDGFIHPSWLLGSTGGQNPSKKNICFNKRIQWSNSSRKLKTWIFHYWGIRVEITAVSQTFWLPLFPQKHFKRSRYKFFLQIDAKFGDYKDNKKIHFVWKFWIFYVHRSAWLAAVRWGLAKSIQFFLSFFENSNLSVLTEEIK